MATLAPRDAVGVQGVGMVLAQDPPTPPQRVLVHAASLGITAQDGQGDGEVVGGVQAKCCTALRALASRSASGLATFRRVASSA